MRGGRAASDHRGKFITFEGPDGCGKTTQVERLVDVLRERGVDVVRTREPGGTLLGERLRQLLLAGGGGTDGGSGPVPVAEMLLMAADRTQHVHELIRPALERGAVVISDRYVDSSIAYQAGGLGLPESDVRRVNALATGGLLPDLTILLDIEPEDALHRAGVRPAVGAAAGGDRYDPEASGPQLDRIERRGIKFQERVVATYRRLAALESSRWERIDVTGQTVDEVATRVWAVVAPFLQKAGFEQCG